MALDACCRSWRLGENERELESTAYCTCVRDNIPEDELFLAVGGEYGVGWQTVCESCDDGDGSLRFHDKTIVELGDVTAFGSAEFDENVEALSVWSMLNGGWCDDY